MPKIAHISDTHIKTLKEHEEYRQVFEKIYEHLRNESVDYVVHTGDIAHTKTQISPEFVDMCGNFFTRLAEIAPLHIILGNHDGNLRNSSRQDAISPIVTALNNPRIVLYKNSGEYLVGDNLSFNVLSVFDKEGWVKPSSQDRINIALYHGSINGVVTDTGYIIEHGDDCIDIFEGHDYAMLGDIHLANQTVDPDGRMRYAGSTVQQNFGETNDKGFLIWDIQDKDKFNVKHIKIGNPKPFINVVVGPDGEIGNEVFVPRGARIRLIANTNLSVDKVKAAIDTAKKRFNPESVTFVNKSLTNRENLQQISSLSRVMNLRDLAVQEEIIRTYLKEYNPDTELLEKIYNMNKRFNSQVEQGEEIARNIDWKIRSLEWDNLFNYGESNKLNFDKLNGVVGIFGKNYTGKSSIIDALMYTVFNTTSKNNRKNLNIINQNRDKGRGKIVFDINGNEYIVERTSEKYTKKSKGVEITEAKTDVTFSEESDELHNGLDRSDTDKNIRRFVGTVDDFLLTSMASQLNSLAFISEGSTQRKAILAKFLDLDMFETKFKLAKCEASEIKTILKKLEATDYDKEIELTKKNINDSEQLISLQKENVNNIEKRLEHKRESMFEVNSFLKNAKIEHAEASEIYISKINQQNILDSVVKKLVDINDKLQKIDTKKKELQVGLLAEPLKTSKELAVYQAEVDALEKIEVEYTYLIKEINNGNFATEYMKEIPCKGEFPNCGFIKQANRMGNDVPAKKERLVQLNTDIEKIKGLMPKYIELYDSVEKHVKCSEQIEKIVSLEKDLLLEKEKNTSKRLAAESIIEQCDEKLSKIQNQKQIIDEIEKNKDLQRDLKQEIAIIETSLNSAQQKITALYKENGYHVSHLETLEEQKQELEEKRKEFAAYDLYLKAMHPNGISYQVIKNKLPIINAEINKMLVNVVDFQVFLVNEDDKLDIMIKHPKYDARPLEMGSGAEKSLASIAIRLAFLTVSSLPKSDIFILDEPGTALDSENLAGFIRILELIKGYFKTVLLISHLDVLKDAVDMQINIDRQGGFAYVNQ